ncbi:protein APCDD1-like isoform X2 [Balaenoptera ricei]|uniref:protein APCDD1-like isoform X2 n=1 Tax=Balaenoptera ricei TaxID=2746895 RepID=UPI0028BD80F7|nr:protein APCDD1-like isoform X2 [Balaenoptera ricei]
MSAQLDLQPSTAREVSACERRGGRRTLATSSRDPSGLPESAATGRPRAHASSPWGPSCHPDGMPAAMLPCACVLMLLGGHQSLDLGPPSARMTSLIASGKTRFPIPHSQNPYFHWARGRADGAAVSSLPGSWCGHGLGGEVMLQKEPWLSRQARADGLARSPALSPGAAWAPGQLSPARPARGSTHQRQRMLTPSPGVIATPTLQRQPGWQGVATCAGDHTASSSCPTERPSPHCCPHAWTGPGSPLGTPRAGSPPTHCSSRARCACAAPPGSPGAPPRPTTTCTRWASSSTAAAPCSTWPGAWTRARPAGPVRAACPPPGPGCRGPCTSCWAPGLSGTARPPWASPCTSSAWSACSAACSPSPGPRPGWWRSSTWGTSTPTGPSGGTTGPPATSARCRAPCTTPAPARPAASSPAPTSTTRPCCPARRPCPCAWAAAGSAPGARCAPPCSSSPGSSPSTRTTAPGKGITTTSRTPPAGSPPSPFTPPAATPRARRRPRFVAAPSWCSRSRGPASPPWTGSPRPCSTSPSRAAVAARGPGTWEPSGTSRPPTGACRWASGCPTWSTSSSGWSRTPSGKACSSSDRGPLTAPVPTPRRRGPRPTKPPWCSVTGWPGASPGLCCRRPSAVGGWVPQRPLSPSCSWFSGWPSSSGYEIGL